MSVKRIASRYANTLVDLSKEQGIFAEVREDVKTIFEAIQQNSELQRMLDNPVLTTKVKTRVLDQIFKEHVHPLTLRFMLLVCQKGRETFLPDMLEAFEEEYRIDQQISHVMLETAHEIDASSMESIKSKISELRGIRKNIELAHSIAPELIGGFIVRYDDKVYDASVAYQLKKLRKSVAN